MGTSANFGDTIREVLSVATVLGLLGVLLWFRRGAVGGGVIARLKPQTRRVVESLDRLPLTPQHAVHVIRFADKEMVIATHPQGCTVLAERAPLAARAAGGSE
jgi:flagellar biogenesis protein FliO